jgi:hypothetical protein
VNARLLTLTGRELVRALQRAGFSVIRIKAAITSSGMTATRRAKRSCRCTATKTLGRPLLRKILNDVGVTVDELIAQPRSAAETSEQRRSKGAQYAAVVRQSPIVAARGWFDIDHSPTYPA